MTVVVVATEPGAQLLVQQTHAIAGSADKAHAAAATAATDSTRTTPAPARCPSAGSGLLATPGSRFNLMQNSSWITPL